MRINKYKIKNAINKTKASIRSFFLKLIFIVIASIGVVIGVLYSNFGNSYSLIFELKTKLKNDVNQYFELQSETASNKVRASLGLPPTKNAAPDNSAVFKGENKSVVPDKVEKTFSAVGPTSITTEKSTNNEISYEVSPEAKALPLLKLNFYYDNTNAPTDLQQSLNLIEKASAQWTYACNVQFAFKGEKHADYVSTQVPLHNATAGVIKWSTQMENDNAIGEAHMGGDEGPVRNFVMGLNAEYFTAKNPSAVISTLTHEMGHVIGLDHSKNSKSLMYYREGTNQKMQSADQAMCLYLRARWSGMSQDQAAEKYSLVF